MSTFTRKAHDIAAYTFNAETLCPGDMREAAIEALLELDGISGELLRNGTTEELLDRWADVAAIEREDENTYDSGDFPKVVFVSQVIAVPPECCDSCGGEL